MLNMVVATPVVSRGCETSQRMIINGKGRRIRASEGEKQEERDKATK